MKVKSKKSLIIALTICAMVASVFLSGFAKASTYAAKSASGKQVKISFMGWGGPDEKKTFTELTKKFMEKYPNVKVEYINVPASDFMTKLQTMIAANKEPDCFYLPPDYLMRFVSSGNLLDLTPYMNNSKIFKKNNVWPNLLSRYRYDGKTVGKGAIYALPKDVGPFALAYNKDLFKEAGITPPSPDKAWTFDEFIANAQKLTKGSGQDKQFGVAGYNVESAIWSHNGDWLDSSKTKVTINTPNFIAGLQFYADLMQKYQVAPTRTEEQSLGNAQRWLDGKVAMIGTGPWDQASFWNAPFEWDIMQWPSATGKPGSTWYGSMGFGVSKKTAYKQEAFNLAAYLAFDVDGQRTNYQMGQAVPNLIDMAKGEYVKMGKAPATKKVLFDIIEKYGRPAAAESTFNGDWIGEFWGSWDNVNNGKMTAAQYCKEEQPKMQKLLDKAIAQKKAAEK